MCCQVLTVPHSKQGVLVVFIFVPNPSYTITLYPDYYPVVTHCLRDGGEVNSRRFW